MVLDRRSTTTPPIEIRQTDAEAQIPSSFYIRLLKPASDREFIDLAPHELEFPHSADLIDIFGSTGLDTEGTKLSVLVLEHDGKTQVVATNYDGIIGQLLWGGDLDGDNELDLYFDDYNEKGAFVVGLYLSSAAERGRLVKRVAMFATAGC